MRVDETKLFKKYCNKRLSKKQLDMVATIKKEYGLKSHQVKIIANFCMYNVRGNWVERYKKYIDYVKEHGNKQTRESYMLRFGENKGAKKYNDYCLSKVSSLENFIKRYGELEGRERWKLFCKRNKGNKTRNRFVEKYGEEEGVKKFEQLRCNEKEKGTLKYKIKLHGISKGELIYKEHQKALHHGASIQGFIDKYGEVMGRVKMRESKDNTSLYSFQKRYGYEEGRRKYNEYIVKKKYDNTLQGFISRYGDEGKGRYTKWLETSCLGSCKDGVSPLSQELFEQVDESDTSFYAKKNKEFVVNHGIGSYFYDYVDIETRKVIEFNGDIYHGNPTIFCEDDTPNPYNKSLTCKDMWKKDKLKIDFIKNKGYNVLVVWEKDYKANKNQTIRLCKDFLYD